MTFNLHVLSEKSAQAAYLRRPSSERTMHVPTRLQDGMPGLLSVLIRNQIHMREIQRQSVTHQYTNYF